MEDHVSHQSDEEQGGEKERAKNPERQSRETEPEFRNLGPK
jgi:hypothetical protein